MTNFASSPQPVFGSKTRSPSSKTLFSLHYLQTRLPEHIEWAEGPLPVLEAVRWRKARRAPWQVRALAWA